MVLWPILALSASLLWAIVNIIDKKLVTNIFQEYTNLFLLESIVVLICALLVLLFGNINFSVLHAILLSLLIGVIESIFTILYYHSLRTTSVSVITILLQLIPIFSIFLGVFFFNDQLNLNMYIGLFLVIIASIMVSFETKYDSIASIPKVLILMFIASILVSIGYSIEKYVLSYINANSVFVFSRIGQSFFALFLLIFSKIRKKFIIKISKIPLKIHFIIFFIVIINLIAVYLQTLAYKDGYLSIVTVLSSMQPIIVFIIVLIANKIKPNFIPENHSIKFNIIRILAIILTITGIIIIRIV